MEKNNIYQKIPTIAMVSFKHRNRSEAVFKSAAPDSLHPRILRAGKGDLYAVKCGFSISSEKSGEAQKKRKNLKES